MAQWTQWDSTGADLGFYRTQWEDSVRTQWAEEDSVGAINRAEPGIRVVAQRLGGPLERRWTPRAVESWQHASQVWEQVRRAVVSRTPALERITAGAQDRKAALGGQADLVAVALLGAHLGHCERCWMRWRDGYRPGDILTAAVKRRPAGAVFRAAETETKARRRARRRR